MRKLVIDANELKTISNHLANLIEKANQARSEEVYYDTNIPYKVHSLSDKEKLVFEYIRKNPGTVQENVVKNIRNYSRVPVLNAIRDLKNYDLIFIKKDEHNRKNTVYL